jgi:bifunctional non-homologous end joining protein LigD
VHVQNKKIKLLTRNGNDWTDQFKGLVKSFENLTIESAIFDGEAVVLDKEGRSNFGKLQETLSVGEFFKIKFFIFDLLYLNGVDLRALPLKKRKEILKGILLPKSTLIFFSEDVNKNGKEFFKISCEYGLEGIVSKDSTAPYHSGRSGIWCKSKCTKRQEFVIGGFTEGKGNREEEFGALLLGVHEKHGKVSKFRYVGKVGTGFDSKLISVIKKKVVKLTQKKSSFDIKSPKEGGVKWIRPKLVAEIKFANWTDNLTLRNPVFLGFRTDKNQSEIIMEKETHLKAEDIVLTHPDKVLFKTEKITKQKIADYYQQVSPLMLPYITDRPLSLVRCPNGGDQKCFYQKHPGLGKTNHLHSFNVEEKFDTGLYLSLDSPLGLRQLVQMNAFEIHTWNCHYQQLLHPDQIVIDFDPAPDVSFKAVVEACLTMKKNLNILKLDSFIKVTGGKGIHIHIPIEPLYSWEEVKAFSKALADEMVSINPDLYIATMSKTKREEKIFIDYLRNTYGATAVAPYAIRAKAVSSVALPIEWSELTSIKSADQFTIKKALLKIKNRKSDPWKKFLNTKQRIKLLD